MSPKKETMTNGDVLSATNYPRRTFFFPSAQVCAGILCVLMNPWFMSTHSSACELTHNIYMYIYLISHKIAQPNVKCNIKLAWRKKINIFNRCLATIVHS